MLRNWFVIEWWQNLENLVLLSPKSNQRNSYTCPSVLQWSIVAFLCPHCLKSVHFKSQMLINIIHNLLLLCGSKYANDMCVHVWNVWTAYMTEPSSFRSCFLFLFVFSSVFNPFCLPIRVLCHFTFSVDGN